MNCRARYDYYTSIVQFNHLGISCNRKQGTFWKKKSLLLNSSHFVEETDKSKFKNKRRLREVGRTWNDSIVVWQGSEKVVREGTLG
jgi:hypothetical protein